MATALIEHVLAHQIAQNDAVPAAAPHVASLIQQQRIIAHAELEEGLNGPVIHRYVHAGYMLSQLRAPAGIDFILSRYPISER